MTKLLIGLLGAGVIATGGYAAATSVDSDPARTVLLPGATSPGATADTTTGATTTHDIDDISGPCDEAEHRNDPRCTGVNTHAPAPAPATTAGDDHDDDRSGHGSDGDHHDDDDDDRSGSNSGKG